MEHRPGHLHGNADGLSRLTEEGTTLEEQGEEDAMLIQSVNVEPLSNICIKATQKQDPVLSQVVDWLISGARPARRDVEGGGRNFCRTGHSGEGCFSRMVWCSDAGKTK